MALDQETTLAARVDALESRDEIHRLVSNYCHGCDKHDIDRFMSIWHEDAVWEIGPPYGGFAGSARIRHAMVDLIWTALPETHHWTTNLVVDLDGDRAGGLCDVTCDAIDAEGRTLLIAATYTDAYERRDGTWRIARRGCEIFYFTPVVVAGADGTPTIEEGGG
jgi:gamma-hexachlorocyclohexane dehydrochlorinase